eukprot:CAMPEP_0180614028 /NCGR_PEP_ID=MMETSP1037_2-20121125/31205_1 /TAXON_ID=632150 /ORGANISM="Azadinium spinosum, Strain 3D9" /LENGTH=356 /DNA_ID=CAMNT_0022633727 /DNA_START=51 /DNA_END=1121 /DNA_ORIENTATION=+
MCIGLLAIELMLNRFQVLPLLFPGMFSIREKRFYFFDFDISDVMVAEKLRGHAKMLVRCALCVVLSYLWQHCVLETSQHVGTNFPVEACDAGKDCFASELHFTTLFSRQHTAVDCNGPREDFQSRVVVSCIRFVDPDSTQWLMHLAIAHSVTQLNLKCYEVLVWVAGNSKWVRRFILLLTILFFISQLALFFAGMLSEFVSSWLSFVTSFSVPTFLFTVWRSGKVLDAMWKQDALRMQRSIEEHLSTALSSFEEEGPEAAGPHGADRFNSRSPRPTLSKMAISRSLELGAKRARSLLKRAKGLHRGRMSSSPQSAGSGSEVFVFGTNSESGASPSPPSGAGPALSGADHGLSSGSP